MSDPLSVAGTAVGIASLGIQVCKDLVWYLQSVQGRKQDVADHLREVQTLVSIFYSINDILSKLDQRNLPASSTIRKCLHDSQEKLRELQQVLIKLRGPQYHMSPSPTQQMKEAARLAIYPFREGKVNSLRDSVQSLLNNLNLVITSTSLESNVAHHDKIETLRAGIQRLGAESQAQHDDLMRRVQDNSDQLRLVERNVADSLDEVKQGLARIEVAVQDIGQEVSAKFTVMEDSITSGTRFVAEGMAQISENHELQMAVLGRLDLQMCRIQETLQDGLGSALVGHVPHGAALPNASRRLARARAQAIEPSICTCVRQPQSSTFSYQFWGFKFQVEQHNPGRHSRVCKLYGISESTRRTARAQLPLKLLWWSRQMTIASFECAVGTSDPGISVRYRNVVPRAHSPVYTVMNEMVKWAGYPVSRTEIVARLQSAEREIISLYRDKRASPTDRDESGTSHFMMLVQRIITSPPSIRSLDDLIFPEFLTVLQTLQFMSQANDETIDPRHLLYINKPNVLKFLSWLAGHTGLDLAFQRLPSPICPHFVGADDLVALMDIPLIGRAILRNSLIDLEECISRYPESPMDFVLGMNTIQLSVHWPQGLRRLLQTKALDYINDSHGKAATPFHRAASGGYADSVEILINAGCRFDLNVFRQVNGSGKCANHIASGLAQRRSDLLALAQQRLGILRGLDPSDVGEADNRAASLCQALDEAGVSIPSALCVEWDYTSIYDCEGVNALILPVFFRHGFRSCNAHDGIGLTPIMKCGLGGELYQADDKTLENLQWLTEYGLFDQTPEDPFGIGLNLHATGRHYIAAKAATVFGFNDLRYASVLTHVEKVSQETCRDNCTCWCNPEGRGCSPLKSFLNAIPRSDQAPRAVFPYLFHGSEDLGVPSGGTVDLFLEIVRLLTFETLEMTHTCCVLEGTDRKQLLAHCKPTQHPPQNKNSLFDCDISWSRLHLILNRDPEETERIRSDQLEQAKASQLNTLMEEFSQVVQAPDSPRENFMSFLWGHWRQRICKLFAVDQGILGEMTQSLRNVETYVLPETVRLFLGEKFGLLTDSGREVPEDWMDWMYLETGDVAERRWRKITKQLLRNRRLRNQISLVR